MGARDQNKEATCRLTVRVTPRSSRNEIISYDGEVAQVRVSAPPVDSTANAACTELIARLVGVRSGSVEIVGGAHSRNKVLQIDGVTREVVDEKLRVAVKK